MSVKYGAAVADFATARIAEGYRTVLEDRAEVIPAASGLVLVVADGAGGRPGGKRAAEMAVGAIGEAAATLRKLQDPPGWSRLLAEIDQRLLADPEAGETTAVAAALSPAGIAGASVGDSGAWLITPDSWEDLTERQHPKPFLGTGAAFPVPFAACCWTGTLLIASDGLLKYADTDRICEVAREADIEQAAKELVDLVRLRSGALPDDVSVILCRPL